MTTTLLTTSEREQLLPNGEQHRCHQREDPDTSIDFMPVMRLFTPDAGCAWLLTELDPAEPDVAFGLCDLGLGCPETRVREPQRTGGRAWPSRAARRA
jgi:hypothetical protein